MRIGAYLLQNRVVCKRVFFKQWIIESFSSVSLFTGCALLGSDTLAIRTIHEITEK